MTKPFPGLSKVLAEEVPAIAFNVSPTPFVVNLLEFDPDVFGGLPEVLMLALDDSFKQLLEVLTLALGDTFNLELLKDLMLLEASDPFKELLKVLMLVFGDVFPEVLVLEADALQGLLGVAMLVCGDAFPQGVEVVIFGAVLGLSELISRLDVVDFKEEGSGGVGRIRYFTRSCNSLLNFSRRVGVCSTQLGITNVLLSRHWLR